VQVLSCHVKFLVALSAIKSAQMFPKAAGLNSAHFLCHFHCHIAAEGLICMRGSLRVAPLVHDARTA
jgi:hypothetical protein